MRLEKNIYMNFLANTHCKPSCKHKIKINKTRKKINKNK